MKKSTKKKIYMLVTGLLLHGAALILKNMHLFDSRIVIIFLSLIQYTGMFLYISAIHYFGTTYQYEKYPKESRQTLIDLNDERTRTIHDLAKARTFDVMTYVLICLPFLLIDTKADMISMICSAAVLLIFGISYAYFLTKYKKEM